MHLPVKYWLALLLAAIALPLSAQQCTVQSTVMHPAILPSDTFELDGTQLGGHVLQIVYRRENLVFGLVFPTDSVVITGFDGLLPAMQATCHTSNPSCTVYPDSAAQLRGCITVSNTQTMYSSPNYPGYELLRVFVGHVVYFPFVGSALVPDTLLLHYRVHNFSDTLPTASSPPLGLGLELQPNPATQQVQVSYVLGEDDAVSISVSDALGRVVLQASLGQMGAGKHAYDIDLSHWPAGIYVVTLHTGQAHVSRRLMKAE